MLTMDEVLRPLARLRTDEIVVTSMASVRPWAQYSNSPFDFASADSAMGHAADFALGLALAQPRRKIICLNGDGSMLMSLGTLVTIVHTGIKNLVLFILENGTYEITGNQPIPGAGFIDFAALAKAAGFGRNYTYSNAEDYRLSLPTVVQAEGPTLVNVKVRPGNETPLRRAPKESAPYLRYSLAEAVRRLQRSLHG